MGVMLGGALVLCLLAAPLSARATTVTCNFTLGNFVNAAGTDASPITSVSGSFTVTFTLPASYTNDTTDIVVDSFSISPSAYDSYASVMRNALPADGVLW